MRYQFHPEALAEYDAAAAYYAACQPGLEIRFIDAVQAAIRRACEAPERSRKFDGDIRRCLVHVFPYAVLYSIEKGFIYIVAVTHCHREPGYWKERNQGQVSSVKSSTLSV
jgi:plasmid stabilization system protein ParE